MIYIRQLENDDLTQVTHIDTSETGTQLYQANGDQLQIIEEDWQRPQWDAETWQRTLARWAETLKSDLYLGAYEGDRLVGLAGLRYQLTPAMAQLTVLYVSRTHRHQGVATQLTQELFRLSRAAGAQRIYVSSMPSIPAVHFYMSQGFQPTTEPDPQLFALEPEDVHMVRPL